MGTLEAVRLPAQHNGMDDAVSADTADVSKVLGKRGSVWLYDPWCFTPWYTAALARALRTADVGTRLVCPRYHFEPEFFASCGLAPRPGMIDIVSGLQVTQPALRKMLRSAENLANTAALAFSLLQRRPQILHLQLCPLLARGVSTDLRLLAWAKRRGACAVHTVHNLLPHDAGKDAAGLHRRLYRMCDRLICHSEDVATRLSAMFGVRPERVDVIPHGPLFAERPEMSAREARLRLSLDPDRFLFVWQGILAPYKGTDLLLDAWADLQKRLPAGLAPPCLLIAGRGSAEEVRTLEAKVRRLALENSVRLDLRYISATELPYYYQAADALLYPYREITTSGALMTGLNYEAPIIATDLPAFRAVIGDGVNGLLLGEASRDALAGAMLRLVTDSTLLQALRRGAAGNRQRQVQWSEIANRTRAVYEKALLARRVASASCAPQA